MQTTRVHIDHVEVQLGVGPDIRDITQLLIPIVALSEIEDGHLWATMVGSTGSLTTIEYEDGVVADLKRAIEQLAPPNQAYQHEQAWHDGNGHSHVQAALLGPSIAVPVRGGKLCLGTWQQVVAINHDNRPRNRLIEVSVLGSLKDANER